jgi:hypothetical protein
LLAARGCQLELPDAAVTWIINLHACRLLQAVPEAQITIYASKFGSDVTTHGAAGVWMPYKLSETPEVLTDRLMPRQYRNLPHSNSCGVVRYSFICAQQLQNASLVKRMATSIGLLSDMPTAADPNMHESCFAAAQAELP